MTNKQRCQERLARYTRRWGRVRPCPRCLVRDFILRPSHRAGRVRVVCAQCKRMIVQRMPEALVSP